MRSAEISNHDSRGNVTISPNASVAESARVGDDTTIWANAEIREEAVLGDQCTVGRGVYIDRGVHIGDRCKIEDNALIYSPAELSEGVFIGPAAVLTNDKNPRAINPDGTLKLGSDWEAQGVRIGRGASIGAAAVIVAGVQIGEWALVGAGAVVVTDVRAHSLVIGAPAVHRAWVGRSGRTLQAAGEDKELIDPDNGDRYELIDGQIRDVR